MKTMRYDNFIFNIDAIECVIVDKEEIRIFTKGNAGDSDYYNILLKEISLKQEVILGIIETKLNSGESFNLNEAFAAQERYYKEVEESLGDVVPLKTVGSPEKPATSQDIADVQKQIKIESELI